MTFPLVVLALATILIGLAGFAGFNQGFAWFLDHGVNVDFPVAPALDANTFIGVGAGVLGILLAIAVYGYGLRLNVALASSAVTRPSTALLYRKLLPGRAVPLAHPGGRARPLELCALFDAYVIDGIVNGSARAVRGLGNIDAALRDRHTAKLRRGDLRWRDDHPDPRLRRHRRDRR